MLAAERDRGRRQLIARLLAEEEAKLTALECPSSPGATADEGASHLNLEYCRKRLAIETNLALRGILARLIAEEEATIAPPEARKINSGD